MLAGRSASMRLVAMAWCPSIHGEARGLDDIGPASTVTLEEICHVGARRADQNEAGALQRLLRFRCLQGLDDAGLQGIEHVVWRARWRKVGEPGAEVHLGQTGFGERRHVGKGGRALVTRDGKRAKLAAFYLGCGKGC